MNGVALPTGSASPRLGRAFLWLAGAIAVLALAVLFVLSRSGLEEIELNTLARYEAEIAARPQLEKDLVTLRAQEASMSGLLGGENAAVAGARLQSQIQALVQASGGVVRTTQDMPAAKRSGFEQITVVCEMSLPLNKLEDLLFRIDAATPYLFVDDAIIQANDDGGHASEAVVPQLGVRLTIHAFRALGAS